MNYKICKLNFTSAVHFGEGGLTTSGDTLMADTIFAALCTEAADQGGNLLDKLVDSTLDGRLLISDGLPYIGKTLYVPKPVMEVQTKEDSDVSIKKYLKKLRYIPIEKIETYLQGNMNITEEAEKFQDGFSISDMLEKVTVPEGEKTTPYAVAVRRYKEGSGLYLCVGYEDEDSYLLVSELLEALSYSGIGGERSSGCGRFEVTVTRSSLIEERLNKDESSTYMSLSVCLPAEDELDYVIGRSNYMIVRRSGWVSSISYADTMRKKKDIYMLAAGSVFQGRFRGDIFDVNDGGRHPVYRYGKPMLMGL